MKSGWIGVDFDGTLAIYNGWQGPTVFGDPIPAMVTRIKRWLEQGYEVRVVTARAFSTGGQIDTDVVEALDSWMRFHVGQALPITCSKDFDMIELWDDRCVQVVQNTGEPVAGQVSRTVHYQKLCRRCNTLDAVESRDFCAYCLLLSPADFDKPFTQQEQEGLRW